MKKMVGRPGFWEIHVMVRLALTLYIMMVIISAALADKPDMFEFEKMVIKIVNYSQSLEYLITTPTLEPVLIATQIRKAGPGDPLAEVVKNLVLSRDSRRESAARFRDKSGKPIKWANLSPDNNYALVGFQDPSFENMYSAALMRVSDRHVLYEIKVPGSILDSLWSHDSKVIAILESTEYMKKTPWGLLAALSGHPIKIQTFFVRAVDPISQRETRIKIVDGIENASALLEERNEGDVSEN
ncbi:MAG: hypothetical protein MPW14_17925 [Candidatus Manganitrophus sp.]|nr:hypothetical protein [Candidatus Manganitrophus sp.]MDC4225152.1 hypothetical protein [Candidatus Manganitrophus sp.]WDT69399.1 MAG: hypothetical protein MPW17_11405 [Candidatus Manganitrophus sp.]WDT74378.1 MAG: hypothetical protein MPW16_14085 [Candidatus Manganitrophus sp.]WDT79014.1 MAG: hypothetical protein MPW14_17925 [Candidatus Manganitrophus sp.]